MGEIDQEFIDLEESFEKSEAEYRAKQKKAWRYAQSLRLKAYQAPRGPGSEARRLFIQAVAIEKKLLAAGFEPPTKKKEADPNPATQGMPAWLRTSALKQRCSECKERKFCWWYYPQTFFAAKLRYFANRGMLQTAEEKKRQCVVLCRECRDKKYEAFRASPAYDEAQRARTQRWVEACRIGRERKKAEQKQPPRETLEEKKFRLQGEVFDFHPVWDKEKLRAWLLEHGLNTEGPIDWNLLTS